MGNFMTDLGYSGTFLPGAMFGGGYPGGPTNTPDAQRLKDDRDLYGALIFNATDRLGADINAPQAVNPGWLMGQTRDAGVTNMDAAAMNAATANAAQMNAAKMNMEQANQARLGQNQLVGSLQGTAAGQGPSVAQEHLRQATNANINQQMAAAQSAHGAARLAALRNASTNQANIQQQAASQSAALRAQEIAAAQANLGSALGMQRGQDITTAGTQAGLEQQAGALNAQMQQGTNLANAGFGQQAGLANAGFTQAANSQNAQAANAADAANANAWNQAQQNWAAQSNAGNLSLANANLMAQQNTDALNLQRAQAQFDAELRAMQGRADVSKTLFQGMLPYEKEQRESGGLFGKIGGAAGGAMFGGGGGGFIGGLF